MKGTAPVPDLPLTANSRRTPQRKWAVWSLVILLVGCVALLGWFVFPNPDVDSIFADEVLEVFAYEAGRPIEMARLAPHSAQTVEICRMLRRHRRRWILSFVSFAPDLFIRGKNVSVDVHDELIVLNYVCQSRDVQAISPAQAYEVRHLRELLRGELRPSGE
jgi:hypothetical protein